MFDKTLLNFNNNIEIVKTLTYHEVIILLPLFVINNILSNIDGLPGFTQTCHYHSFYIVVSFPHATPVHIFFQWSCPHGPDVREHKGQNSAETQCRGCLVL